MKRKVLESPNMPGRSRAEEYMPWVASASWRARMRTVLSLITAERPPIYRKMVRFRFEVSIITRRWSYRGLGVMQVKEKQGRKDVRPKSPQPPPLYTEAGKGQKIHRTAKFRAGVGWEQADRCLARGKLHSRGINHGTAISEK
jgi:hypothetical protein